jgi:predicted Zn-dependent protease
MSHSNNLYQALQMGLLIFCLLMAFSHEAKAQYDLPLLGENAALNLEKEIEIGEGFYQRLKERGFVIDDPLLSRYLSDIGESLLTSLAIRIRDYHFYLVKDSSVNAFATPGGYIGVHAGLISMSRSEDELASVLAHEIAHVELMHSMQMLDKARDVNLASMISILAAILVSSQDADLAGALIYSGAAGSAQSMVNFTRTNEYEADRVGIELLKKSDYDPSAMADFMRLLQSREQAGELGRLEYIRTHPVSSNRIAEIQARTQRVDRDKAKNRRFGQFKDYLLYLYPQLSYSGKKSEFFEALQLTRNGQFKQAENIYHTLIQSDPDSIWYSYALAENLEYQGRLDESAQLYRSMLLLYPDDLAIGARLAKIYIKQERYSLALGLVERLLNDHENETLVYELQVKIYTALSNDVSRQLAEANYHWFNGSRERAKKLFKALLAQGVLDAGREEGINLKLEQK